MIPNKLYIPTSTLNFNNIMSSESISPAGFYSVRGFGYRRFEKVEPNNLENRIILYDKYPVFNINDKELENYSMIVEIDTKAITEDTIQEYKDGVFYTEKTIYINPFTTRIFFGNEAEKTNTLSKAEPSIETKMVTIYRNCFCIKGNDIESFTWQRNEMPDTTVDFSKYISKDLKINKLKGLLYAYSLGANKSLQPEIVALKKYIKELKNVLSAIITSPDNRATYKQEEQLNGLCQSINNTFYKIEGLDKKFQNIIKQKVEQYKCENFIDILKSEGLFDTWYNKQNLKPSFQLTQFYISHSSSPDDKQKAFDNYISGIENAINLKIAVPRNIEVKNLPIIQHGNKVETILNQKEFLSKLLNEYLNEAYNCKDFLQSRYDFAFSGGKLFREELQEKWEGSEFQMYINTLLKNLKEYTPFALNSTDNLTLKSFGAFCQKGEDDIDKLEDYLISNEIGDFKIAFALWGIVFGFANMPKTLTNDLFSSYDLDYVSEVYKYIYKQVHGIELEGKLERKQEEEFVTVSSKTNEGISIKPKTKEGKEMSTKQQANEIEIEYREKLKQVLKATKSQIDSVIEVLKNNHFVVNSKLFDTISKIDKLGKRTNAFKAIKECLQPENLQVSSNSNDLFLNNTKPDKEFYKDINVLSFLEIPKNKQKKIKEEIEWIQKVHKEGGYKKQSGEWVELTDHTNAGVIRHFENNSKLRIEATLLTQIVSKLKTLYSHNER